MNLLVLAGAYPHTGHPFAGTFNEKCCLALKEHCQVLQVFSPRPFATRFIRFHPRWNSYGFIPAFEIRKGIPVLRPAVPVIPRIASSLWIDTCAYMFLRRAVQKQHCLSGFDAIMSFDLGETGGIAWRLGKNLGIPASGWAFGEDVRYAPSSALGAVVRRAIQNLSCVFYQSNELLERARELLGDTMTPDIARRQSVLPHGIPAPPVLQRDELRRRVRCDLNIDEKETLVINIGRITSLKGVFDLLDAFSLALAANPLMRCVWVGAKPGFDESHIVAERIRSDSVLMGKFSILPACRPDTVWEYLCAADIFAFPSHREGTSNSLLEAMIMGIPAVTFAIPSNREIDSGANALVMVPPFDIRLFSEQLIQLSRSREERRRLGKLGSTLIKDRFEIEHNMLRALQRLSDIASAERCASLAK